jgi:hypothetical protein
MLTGYNTDFKCKGRIYHCQTEDGGADSPFITSLLYNQGAILASRKTSYADIIKADCLNDVVRELMMEQHKQMIRDLMHGKFDSGDVPHEAAPAAAVAEKPASRPVVAEAPEVVVQPPPPPPVAEDIPEKSLDDIILEFLAQEQKERKA